MRACAVRSRKKTCEKLREPENGDRRKSTPRVGAQGGAAEHKACGAFERNADRQRKVRHAVDTHAQVSSADQPVTPCAERVVVSAGWGGSPVRNSYLSLFGLFPPVDLPLHA